MPLWLLKNTVGKKKRKTLDNLIQKLGVDFTDRSLLDKALLHRSYSSRHQIAKDNERLEFLGDSILNACVSDILYKKFPDKSEGDLTKIRAKIVSRKALKEWGKEIGIEDYIFISDKMKKSMKERETHIIENTMESVIGAMYLDSGYGTVYNFIETSIKDQDFHKIVDFKSQLQEFSVEKYGEIPKYTTVSESGPSHNKRFTVNVAVREKIYGEGTGSSKKAAQHEAAKAAYKKLVKKKSDKE